MIRKFLFFSATVLLSLFLITSCNKDDDSDTHAIDPGLKIVPELSTAVITNINQTSALSGGNIISDGGSSIIEKGVCWSTSENPTIADSRTIEGANASDFTSSITGLVVSTTYYVRAYAANGIGVGYGTQKSFSTTNNLIIGLNYAGGIIFYLDSTELHGYVCAESDQSSNANWGCPNFLIPGADGAAIGRGLLNTNDIINGCDSTGNAASICVSLTLNGFSDWFLPSKDELLLMYTNLKANGRGNFSSGAYWSSTEMTSVYAWEVIFTGGLTQGGGKNSLASVRAVRAF